MSLSGRATVGAPDLQAVLDDPKVQKALRRAVRAGRDTYRQARGKSPGRAVKNKRVRRQAQEAAVAFWQLVDAIDAAQARRARRRGRRAVLVLAVLAGSSGAYLASNGAARQALRNLINHHAAFRNSDAG